MTFRVVARKSRGMINKIVIFLNIHNNFSVAYDDIKKEKKKSAIITTTYFPNRFVNIKIYIH